MMKNRENIMIDKNKKFLSLFDILCNNKNMDYILQLQKEEKKENKLYYFLITDLLCLSDKYKKIFSKKNEMNYYTIKALEDKEENKEKNLIIKIKNLISGLLYNFITLTKDNMHSYLSNDITTILEELLILGKIPYYAFDNSIPIIWYADSLLELIPQLPEDLRKNNCQILIEELINDVNESIKELGIMFESLTLIKNKLNFTKRIKSSVDESIKIIKEIFLNEKIDTIIKKDKIEVGINLLEEKKNKILNIYKNLDISDFDIIDNKVHFSSIKSPFSNTISEFIQNFPDFNIEYKYENVYHIDDFFSFQENIQIKKALNNFFKIIEEHLKDNYKYSEEEFSDIRDKIIDYVMKELFDKLFPKQRSLEEKLNFEKTFLYSWIEPKHLMKNNSFFYIYKSFLTDALRQINFFLNEKSIRKKIDCLHKLYKVIEDVIVFNGGKGVLGADDFVPLLNFAYIKAQPERIYSHIKYCLLYNPNKIPGNEVYYFTQLLSVYEFVNQLSFEKLSNITKEEYNEKMILLGDKVI